MASELVPVEQIDRDAANIAFDDVLGDAGSYAEYMRPSYREGGVRTLTKAFTRHRKKEREQCIETAANFWSGPDDSVTEYTRAYDQAVTDIVAALRGDA